MKGEWEKGLTKKPIRISCPARHKLDELSRLNYAKTYTVEYNVKVWFIGKVHEDSQWILSTDYNRVHPLLQPRGVPPEEQNSTTVTHAQGGSYNTAVYQPELESTTGSWNPAISIQRYTQGTGWEDSRPGSSRSIGSGGGYGGWSESQQSHHEMTEYAEGEQVNLRHDDEYVTEDSTNENVDQGNVAVAPSNEDLYSAD